MVDYQELRALEKVSVSEWNTRDVIIYALGIGLGDDPPNADHLDFIYEKRLKVFPTFPVVIGFAGGPLRDAKIDYGRLLHGEQEVTLHKPIPPEGTVRVHGRITDVWDKGADKGALVMEQVELYLSDDEEPMATIVTTAFARGDGGGTGGSTTLQPKPHQVPSRVPDLVVDIPTAPNLALIYRQSGDLNPLHIDPDVAQRAGFPRPILHGLCTYAITCRAVLQTYCANDASSILRHQVRFSNPVYPGDIITVSLWRDQEIVSFEAAVTARGCKVATNGRSVLSRVPGR